MNLARKIAKLEAIVSAQSEPAVPTFWTPARVETYCMWANRLLGTMPEDRARRVFEELTTLPAESWGPVARRLDHMAAYGAGGGYDAVTWPYWAERAIALPEALCHVLEAHPDASFTIDYSCEDCGLEVPHAPYSGPALLAVCPLSRIIHRAT